MNIILLVPSFEVQSVVVMRGTKGMTILIYEEEKVKRIKLFSWSFHFWRKDTLKINKERNKLFLVADKRWVQIQSFKK